MRICDTHQHLWDLDKFTLPWTPRIPLLDRSYLTRDYLDAARGLGIEKTVYMEVDLAPHQRLAEVEYVASLCESKTTPTVAAVVACEPGAAGFAEYLDTIQTNPYVRGLRRCLHNDETPPGHCLRPEFIADIRRLAEFDLSFDIVIRPAELDDAARLIDACPEVRFILDHCGNADLQASPQATEQWRAGVAAVGERPNVLCKVSGFAFTVGRQPWSAATLRPVIDHVYRCFGPQRLMFGGDWPVVLQGMTLKQWVEALRENVADWPEAEQRALFYDNAARCYRFDG